MPIESMMPSNHIVLCNPIPFVSSICPSIRVFSIESAFPIRLPKYWSFSFSICLSNEYSGLISFRIDWFDIVVQATISEVWLWLREARLEVMEPLREEERRQHVLGQEVVSREEEL